MGGLRRRARSTTGSTLLAGFAADPVDRTLVLAVLRGAMLDLLATGDHARITPAVERLTRRGATELSCG